MANSLEVRPPLLDPEFVGWCYALPARAKVSGSDGKLIFKRAMEGLLPHDLLYRPKQGFTVPLAEWLRHPLKERVRDLACASHLSRSGLFDISTIEKLTAEHFSGLHDNSRPLWQLLCFETFLSKESAEYRPAAQAPAA
jgi:asparagine synthase (glutamine-hydrolysing)